ncbi:hypothetical protein SALBM311S_10305 [Streptomyces alboniger]
MPTTIRAALAPVAATAVALATMPMPSISPTRPSSSARPPPMLCAVNSRTRGVGIAGTSAVGAESFVVMESPQLARVYLSDITLPDPRNPYPLSYVGSIGTGADCHVRKRQDRKSFVTSSGVSFLS